MIRRVIVALLVGAVAGGAVIVTARGGVEQRRHAARESAERRVDEQAELIDAVLEQFRTSAIRSCVSRCRQFDGEGRELGQGDVDSDCRMYPIASLANSVWVTDTLRSTLVVHPPGGAAVEGLSVAHGCYDRPGLVGIRNWRLELGEPFAGLANTRVESSLSRGPEPSDAVVRRRTIPAGTTALEVVSWATIETGIDEPTLGTLWLAFAAFALASMLSMLAGGGSGRDGQLEAAVARIGKGDLDVTLDGNGATVSAFNRMTRELRDARTRLARAERIAAWRDIARRIAHEIKNPLTPIKMAMETARKTHARKHPDFDEIFDESTKTVLEEVNRLEHIVTEFSRFARLPRPNAASINAREVVEKVVAMHDLDPAHATLPEAAKGVRVELSLGQSKFPEVRADREQLTQVLVNLVQNACDAAREKHGETGGRVVVELTATENAGVQITISDNGPGIPLEERGRVLEPYYTTKAHGTGLGMAIVDRIVSDHGGSLTIADSALGGAAVVVTLRREGPPEEPEASTAS